MQYTVKNILLRHGRSAATSIVACTREYREKISTPRYTGYILNQRGELSRDLLAVLVGFLSHAFFLVTLAHGRTHTHVPGERPTEAPLLFSPHSPLLHLSDLFPRRRKIEIVTAAYRERIDLVSRFFPLFLFSSLSRLTLAS